MRAPHVDSDGMSESPLDEFIAESNTADVDPTELADVLFTAREDAPPPAALLGNGPRPDPAVVAAHFAPTPFDEQSLEPESEPIVLPREDRPWSAWRELRRKEQPETPPEPMARAFAPTPTASPKLAESVDAEATPPVSSQNLFAAAADDVAKEPAKVAPSAMSLKVIWAVVALLAAIVIIEGIYIAAFRGNDARAGTVAAASTVGTIHVQSTPPGATVLLNGQDRGETPATLLLAAGDYQLEIVREGRRQPLPVKVKAGAEAVYQVVLPGTAETGGVSVSSEPAGVPVAIDGTRRGITPLTVSDVPLGEHTVIVFGPSGSIQNKVKVTAGAVASVTVTLSAAAKAVATGGTTAVGYVSIDAPVEMQLLENGKLVGTSRMDRIILPAGAHEIEAVNETLGYRATQPVTVTADKSTRLRFEVPSVKVSLNATPWADVTIDGTSVGQTPIGNLSLAIGSHEIVYSHPQLGEQRQTIMVTVSGPNRFSTAMRR
jgi:hypothetical protein